MSQGTSARTGINNAIWLCATCSTLIDKNKGLDYPVDHLRKWKKDHETLIHECLEGNKRIIFALLTTSGGANIAKAVVRTLEDHGALFQPFAMETPSLVWNSLSDLRKSLTVFRAQASDGSDVDITAESMIKACRHYMNTTAPDIGMQELEYSLGAVRKIIGVNLKLLLQNYPMQVSSKLASILPKS